MPAHAREQIVERGRDRAKIIFPETSNQYIDHRLRNDAGQMAPDLESNFFAKIGEMTLLELNRLQTIVGNDEGDRYGEIPARAWEYVLAPRFSIREGEPTRSSIARDERFLTGDGKSYKQNFQIADDFRRSKEKIALMGGVVGGAIAAGVSGLLSVAGLMASVWGIHLGLHSLFSSLSGTRDPSAKNLIFRGLEADSQAGIDPLLRGEQNAQKALNAYESLPVMEQRLLDSFKGPSAIADARTYLLCPESREEVLKNQVSALSSIKLSLSFSHARFPSSSRVKSLTPGTVEFFEREDSETAQAAGRIYKEAFYSSHHSGIRNQLMREYLADWVNDNPEFSQDAQRKHDMTRKARGLSEADAYLFCKLDWQGRQTEIVSFLQKDEPQRAKERKRLNNLIEPLGVVGRPFVIAFTKLEGWIKSREDENISDRLARQRKIKQAIVSHGTAATQPLSPR